MPIFEFSEKYSVNVKSIDDQHCKLFGLINTLHEAMKQSKGKEILGEILNELEEYTRSHFSTEETYMRQFNYPGYSAHVAEHAEFIRRVEKFKQDFEANKLALSLQVMNFLKGWLTEHILVVDQRYSVCFQEHGLK